MTDSIPDANPRQAIPHTNTTTEPFTIVDGTLYLADDATPMDVLRFVYDELGRLPDRPTSQNSRLWTETVNLIHAQIVATLEAHGRKGA